MLTASIGGATRFRHQLVPLIGRIGGQVRFTRSGSSRSPAHRVLLTIDERRRLLPCNQARFGYCDLPGRSGGHGNARRLRLWVGLPGIPDDKTPGDLDAIRVQVRISAPAGGPSIRVNGAGVAKAGGYAREGRILVFQRYIGLTIVSTASGVPPAADAALHQRKPACVWKGSRDLGERHFRQFGRYSDRDCREGRAAPALHNAGGLGVLSVQYAAGMHPAGADGGEGHGTHIRGKRGLRVAAVPPALHSAGGLHVLPVQNAAIVIDAGANRGKGGGGQRSGNRGLIVAVVPPAPHNAGGLHVLPVQNAADMETAGADGGKGQIIEIGSNAHIEPSP